MTRREYEALTRRHGFVWHTPPECQGQIVVSRFAETDGHYWMAVEDTSLPPDHPERVEMWEADPTDPRDVPDTAAWEPWNREPRGIRWRRLAEFRWHRMAES